MKKKIFTLLLTILTLFSLAACADKKIKTDKVQVVFFTYKGDNSVKTLNDIEVGTKLPKPADPIRDGFEFIKWATDPNGIKEWSFENDVVEKSMTVFAIWEQGEFTITYNLNDGEFKVGTQIPLSYEVDKIEYFPVPSRIGYDFVGWYLKPAEEVMTGEEGLRDTNGLISSIELYAKWSPKDIRVTFKSDLAGMELPKPPIKLIKYDSIIDFPDYTAAAAARGYTFLGWFDASGKQYINGEKFDRATQVTITAKFEEN